MNTLRKGTVYYLEWIIFYVDLTMFSAGFYLPKRIHNSVIVFKDKKHGFYNNYQEIIYLSIAHSY